MPAHNFIDLTNQQFGYWTVIGRDFDYCKTHNIKREKPYWICKCRCGKIKSVCGDNLRNGKSTSCGCISKTKRAEPLINELIGKHINEFTVIDVDTHYYDNKNPSVYKTAFKCQCDCGEFFSTTGETIKQNHIHRCPKCNAKKISEKHFKDLTGQTFHKLYVEKFLRMENSRAIFLCRCECGNYKEVEGHSLTSGSTKSCGCLRSYGESVIKKILQINNIVFEEQKTFPTCYFSNPNNLSKFDFYINNEFLLEFDGKQHYESNNTDWYSPENFELIKQRDVKKNEWCKENNIPLKRIPYWELDNITIENIMDDTFLIT